MIFSAVREETQTLSYGKVISVNRERQRLKNGSRKRGKKRKGDDINLQDINGVVKKKILRSNKKKKVIASTVVVR